MSTMQDPIRLMDPQYVDVLRLIEAKGLVPADPQSQPLTEARARAEVFHALWNEDPPAVARIAEHAFAGPAGPVRVRLYRPDERRGLPVVLYFHGGGYVLNSVDTHDRLMRLLALYSGVAVCGVDYTLAPEARFPTQSHEAIAAVRWLSEHGAELGLDATRLALAGDSAGANLAMSTLLALRDAGETLVSTGLLFYGMYAVDFDTRSHLHYGRGAFGLTTARMRYFWDQYLRSPEDGHHPLAAPLHADLTNLPPLMLVGAGLDCLLDDTLRLADRLAAADVAHQLAIYPGVPHSFMQMSRFLDAGDLALRRAGAFLRDRLAGGRTALAA